MTLKEDKITLVSLRMRNVSNFCKKPILYCLLLLYAGMLMAQNNGIANMPPDSFIQSYQEATGEFAALFNGKLTVPYTISYMNHPCFETDRYVKGTLCYNNVVYNDMLMRIDLYRDEITVISPNVQHGIVLENEKIDYAVLHGVTVVTSVDGNESKRKLLVLLHDGMYPVIRKHNVSIRQETTTSRTMTRSFTTQIQVEIYMDGKFNTVKNKNALLKLFPDRKKELNEYAKQHKLNFKKQFEQSVIKIVDHYEDLTK